MARDKENTMWITLTNLDGFNGLPFDQRKIPLTRERNIKIGRASNEKRKDRGSESDNALFHCSVLTRDHARIELPYGPKGPITIKDLSSRHGTFVNGSRLEPWEAKPIWNNDTIQIGSNIELGENVHKCMYMQVIATFPKAEGSSDVLEEAAARKGTYAFPSDSEGDPNDECDFDEADNHDRTSKGIQLEHTRFENPLIHVVAPEDVSDDELDDELDDEFDAESDAESIMPDEHDFSESSVAHSVSPDRGPNEDVVSAMNEDKEDEEEEEYEPDSVGLQLPQEKSLSSARDRSNQEGRLAGLFHQGMFAVDQPVAAPAPSVFSNQMLEDKQPMIVGGDYYAPISFPPTTTRNALPAYAYAAPLSVFGDANDATNAPAGPVDFARVLHEDNEPLAHEEVAPVQDNLIEQCEEMDRKLEAMNRYLQPMLERSAKPAAMSIANLVSPEPQTAPEASPKRKADVLDFNEAHDQAEQTLITAEESMAAELAKDRSVEASLARPHKRPRTLLKEGLKATAYVVAGGVATFGFLLTPYADRLAQA